MTVGVHLDPELVAEMRDREDFYRPAAEKVNDAARRIVARGAGWGRKAFISDVAKEVGSRMPTFARLLVSWHNLGWVEMARADLVGAMPSSKVEASHVNLDGFSDFHFIVAPARRNPARPRDLDRAADLFEGFHRNDVDEVVPFASSMRMPHFCTQTGKAIHVLYRSSKIDPETGKPPRGGAQNYIHEHDAGVMIYEPALEGDDGAIATSPMLLEIDTLVYLGQCLGVAFTDDEDGEEYEIEWSRGVDLFAIPSGKALVIVRGKREIVCLVWGGGLGVEPRGIVG